MRSGGAALAAALALAAPPVAARAAGASPLYLVLPFENTAEDKSLAWLSTGLARALGEDLLGRGATTVDDEERAVFLEGSGLPSDAAPSLASALEVGRRMRARTGGLRPDRLVIGRFNLAQGEIALAARSVDLRTEKARPWVTRQGRLASLVSVEQELASALAGDEGLAAPRGRAAPVPLLAFETYCRAMGEADLKKRLQLLKTALGQYPGYTRAAVQAAALLAQEERWKETASMLARAAADPYPFESDFHLMSAGVALSRNDPASAVTQARRAMDYRDSSRAHIVLGRASLAAGDPAQARAELEKALAIDPADPDAEDLRRALAEEGAQTPRRSP